MIDIANEQGLKVLITSTLRDDEYQLELYKQGRSKPGSIITQLKYVGAHGFGLAFDVCQNIKGKEWADDFFEKIGKIGQSLGLEWGGSWTKFVDKPHFQYVQGLTNIELRSGRMPNFPATPITPAPPPLTWEEIISKASSNPSEWKNAIEVAVSAAKADGDLGALEIFKYLPELIMKIHLDK
jgi:peptidoglycan L-alanyl-D-glutamate endopeptidase CwlK